MIYYRKNIFYIYIVLGALFSSCSTLTKNADTKFKKRNQSHYFQSTGVLKYFHQVIPSWANFREAGKCYLNSNIRYLKMDDMKNSFHMDYKNSTQFQLMYNHKLVDEQLRSRHRQLSFKDEEKIFYWTSQNIQSKIYLFNAPTFKRVNLVWIDSAIHNKKQQKKLKKLFKSKVMDLGYPVFVSLCLGRIELEQFKNKVIGQNSNVKLISSEMFSIYSKSSIKTTRFSLNLNEFFSKNQKLYLYSSWPKSKVFDGKYKFKKY